MRSRLLPLITLILANHAGAETLTLPLEQRPAWLAREGIVMAGSWEPLLFRVRRDGSDGYTPTPQQVADYRREHSPEMVARLKSLGVNFVMMHSYKAFGREAERESMQDAVRFAKLCREAGLRVGVYNNSGTLGWELLFKELPEAKDWAVLDAAGKPVTYGRATYRYYWDRNHPAAQAFHKEIIRFSVEQIQADLLHFDNYIIGPGHNANSVSRFRSYLKSRFKPQQLEEMGITDPDRAMPPTGPDANGLLGRAWLDFSCGSMAESYHDLSRYARTLRSDVLVECNPGGPGNRISPPIDHGRLLVGGEAFWDEGREPGYRDGQLNTRIRTYKLARRMNNIAFAYTTSPLEAAEAMAFNLDCFGCICWFEYGRLAAKPGVETPVSLELAPYIRFFRDRRDLLRNAEVVADVAILRSFPSQVYAEATQAQLTAQAEQFLIENRVPFQIIYDDHLSELSRYRALVLAGCVAMSDAQIEQVRSFAAGGGRVLLVGDAATHDEWLMPRRAPGLQDLPEAQLVRIQKIAEMGDAVSTLLQASPSLAVEGPHGLCAELTERPGRRLVHLVNYRTDTPARNVTVTVQLPEGKQVKNVRLARPEHDKDADLEIRQQGRVITCVVPVIDVYGIVVVTRDTPGAPR
ncbi:MAG TPA: hypothetical protein PLL20_05010 [Phycisphaerae bacterium]|nr:hypothetical protein [Phycisphaerae bacterium]HRR84687.1 hypothetical protein [Phycisphaerae bacterium]